MTPLVALETTILNEQQKIQSMRNMGSKITIDNMIVIGSSLSQIFASARDETEPETAVIFEPLGVFDYFELNCRKIAVDVVISLAQFFFFKKPRGPRACVDCCTRTYLHC